MIRFILACIGLGIYFIITLPIWLIMWVVGKFKPVARQVVSQFLVKWGFRILVWIGGGRLEIRGLENVPDDTPVLFVSNHQSLLDAAVGYGTSPKRVGFVAKVELMKAPFLKQWMDSVHCLFIDRNDMRQSMKVIMAATEELKAGTSIWICPEGTRNKEPDKVLIQEFKDGSFKMAERAKVPVVPVAINGTWACFERQFPKMRKSHIIVEYGKPFLIGDLDKETKKHIGEYAQGIVADMLEKIR